MKQAMSKYCIKAGYHEQLKLAKAIAGVNSLYQPDVYTFAEVLGKLVNTQTVVDIGCGRGERLAKLYDSFFITIGVDLQKAIDICKKSYPLLDWRACDLEQIKPGFDFLTIDELEGAVIICADVVEHLQDPDPLIATIKKWLEHASVAILSTPERDLEYRKAHNGPPQNVNHKREWNLDEFKTYLHSRGLQGYVGLTRTHAKYTGPKAFRTIIAVVRGIE